MKHIHIIGICGTAMAGLATLAQESGWKVTGSDQGVYPPMSTFLAERGIPVVEGFSPANLEPSPDLVLVGNAVSRGNPELEELLLRGIPYRSGAQWLFEGVLEGRHPLVVTGTHGKTTTSSLLAWLLEHAGRQPGFMVGGIPRNFEVSARFPRSPWVVVEGDEYDTAFFDKQPKFLHYHPRTLILGNLEYDHADIYPDLEAIRRQFRILLRLVPPNGTILANGDDPEIRALAAQAFGPVTFYSLGGAGRLRGVLEREDGRAWSLFEGDERLFSVEWRLLGRHNVYNGLAAAGAALALGIAPEQVKSGLESFLGVARRMELRYEVGGVAVFDDFAHHPTAIATTLAGVRAAVGGRTIWAVMEPRSNTMRRRVHQEQLAPALGLADRVILARPQARGLGADELLDTAAVVAELNHHRPGGAWEVENAAQAVEIMKNELHEGAQVIIMSNGGFDNIYGRLHSALTERLTGG